MDGKVQFPINENKGFPVKEHFESPPSSIVPYNDNVIYLVDDCVIEDFNCTCPPDEEVCECEEEKTPEIHEIYKKGFPFYKPSKEEVTPKLAYRSNFTLDDYCTFNKTNIMMKIEKNPWNYKASEICFQLLRHAYEFSEKKNYENRQGLALLEMLYKLFQYFMVSPTLTRKEFFRFFRELLLLYAVQDPPDSLRFFTPMECFEIAADISTLFDRNFDLLRAIVSPNFVILINIEQ